MKNAQGLNPERLSSQKTMSILYHNVEALKSIQIRYTNRDETRVLEALRPLKPRANRYALAEQLYKHVLFWYSPSKSGKNRYKHAFAQLSYEDLISYTGASRSAVTRALRYLERLGLLYRFFDNNPVSFKRRNNVMYLIPDPFRYEAIISGREEGQNRQTLIDRAKNYFCGLLEQLQLRPADTSLLQERRIAAEREQELAVATAELRQAASEEQDTPVSAAKLQHLTPDKSRFHRLSQEERMQPLDQILAAKKARSASFLPTADKSSPATGDKSLLNNNLTRTRNITRKKKSIRDFFRSIWSKAESVLTNCKGADLSTPGHWGAESLSASHTGAPRPWHG